MPSCIGCVVFISCLGCLVAAVPPVHIFGGGSSWSYHGELFPAVLVDVLKAKFWGTELITSKKLAFDSCDRMPCIIF